MLFAFLVAVSATVLSLGAFATTVHAADFDGGSFDGGGWYDAGSFGGGGFYDAGSYSGSDWYDAGSYNNGGFYDAGSYSGDFYDAGSQNSGWYDAGSPNGGWYDASTGYWETDSYNPGYYEKDSYNPGYYETDSYNPGYYETDSYNPGTYQTDSYVSSYMDQYAAGNPIMSGGSYGGGSYGGGYTTGGGYSMPSISTGGCTTCHSQSYPKPVPTPVCTTCNHPVPTPTCTTCGGSSVTNTNMWIDNSIIDNSINGSFNTTIKDSYNTTMLTPVVPQQPIVYTQPAPYCVITLQNAGAYTAQATLVWSSTNAQSAYITQVGSVAPNGTRVVTGFANQMYSLTVTGQGGTYTCNTQPYTPTYIPQAPITPSVSLTQIPYTGLALSPMAQAMYWLALLSVAAAGGYLLVYYKGGALALAGAMNRLTAQAGRQNHFVVSEQETEEVITPEAVETEEVAAPTVDAMSFLPAMQEMKTRDVMSVMHSEDGTPRLVIARA